MDSTINTYSLCNKYFVSSHKFLSITINPRC